ncbi:MAG: NAD-dependent epimerase/dehydratase family protein [Planctomycetota bacterium]|nr:MAG: NAD-dependent epimerase/dehydratase family protein [Planctomycetota bacterium]
MPAEAPVLITGAAGFIGSHLAEALLAGGGRVVGLDCFDEFYDPAVKRENAERLARAGGGRFTMIEADVRDARALGRVFDEHRPGSVVHLAARAGVRPSIADPALYADVNVTGTARALAAAQRAGCRRIVVASSSSVYGGNTKVPFAEDDDVSRPISPYAATKRACELLARTHHHLTGASVACLRFFTCYGPRQRPDLAIHSFMRRIARGEPVPVFGDGSTSRDYTFIRDIVAGVTAALERIEAHGFRVWNLGSSAPVRLDEMVESVARVVGRRPVIDRREPQPGDAPHTFADLTRSRAELGYEPSTPFEDGLAAQWAWLRDRL